MADNTQINQKVLAGGALDEFSHVRQRLPQGLIGIKPDMLDFTRRIVVEKKASAGSIEATRIQLAAYCALLASATREEWNGEIYLFSTNRRETFKLTKKHHASPSRCLL